MKSMTKRLTAAAALLIVGAGLMIGYQASGGAMLAGEPTVVVTVNLGKALDSLTQRADAEIRLKDLRDKLKIENDRRVADLTRMDEDGKTLGNSLKDMADSPQRRDIEAKFQDLQEKSALAKLNYEAWANFNSDKLDVEAALVMEDLYKAIKTAVAQMASASHYDVALVDDSQGELTRIKDTRATQVEQIRQQIASRRLLYANPVIDITDALITRMNNAHKAAGPKAGP